ncbi:hypothetical protein AXF42_Ash001012 [Apostasia shenzhenica]|uniref:Uncharacterized protein n=1 Tax=Apostasia shenzhenica TaxID=1088818 RepID=A0A2I0ATP4_9ASPA|nr:hypothetical protein AXF42_Ash001012 [Apostasia shenzhenica]
MALGRETRTADHPPTLFPQESRYPSCFVGRRRRRRRTLVFTADLRFLLPSFDCIYRLLTSAYNSLNSGFFRSDVVWDNGFLLSFVLFLVFLVVI